MQSKPVHENTRKMLECTSRALRSLDHLCGQRQRLQLSFNSLNNMTLPNGKS
jgi:hypothetical protein